MNHQIQEASSEDSERIAEIVREAYRDVADRFQLTPTNAPTHPSNCTPSWIESDLARGVSYSLLSVDGSPCGCVGLSFPEPRLAELQRVAVLPELRRWGFGSVLVSHGLALARARGAEEVEIGVIAKHTELVEWYRRRGFSLVSRQDFEHLPFTVAFMRCAL